MGPAGAGGPLGPAVENAPTMAGADKDVAAAGRARADVDENDNEQDAEDMDDEDRFDAVMRPFVVEAASACDALRGQYDGACAELGALIRSFGYEASKSFSEVALVIGAFARALQRAEAENASVAARSLRVLPGNLGVQQTPAARNAARPGAGNAPATAPTVARSQAAQPTTAKGRAPAARDKSSGAGAAAGPIAEDDADDGLLPLGGGLAGGLRALASRSQTGGGRAQGQGDGGAGGSKPALPTLDGIRKKLFR